MVDEFDSSEEYWRLSGLTSSRYHAIALFRPQAKDLKQSIQPGRPFLLGFQGTLH